MKIAILEDLRGVAEMLKDVFSKQEDMSCKQVYFNAEDAMQFLVKNPVDVLIVDIGLPKASGIEAIEYLSQYCGVCSFVCLPFMRMMKKYFVLYKPGRKDIF